MLSSEGKEFIKSNNGDQFSGRKEAIDFMIKEKDSPEDIFKLWNTLHLDGWMDDADNLPTGWKKKAQSTSSIKPSQYPVLTLHKVVFRSAAVAPGKHPLVDACVPSGPRPGKSSSNAAGDGVADAVCGVHALSDGCGVEEAPLAAPHFGHTPVGPHIGHLAIEAPANSTHNFI